MFRAARHRFCSLMIFEMKMRTALKEDPRVGRRGHVAVSAAPRAHGLVHCAVFVKTGRAAVHVFVGRTAAEVSRVAQVRAARTHHREPKIPVVGAGLEGDSTGRNQAFDAFNLVQSYFSDNYLDLDSPDDREMFKKWGLYNLKLLLDSYEEELIPQLDTPQIENPS